MGEYTVALRNGEQQPRTCHEQRLFYQFRCRGSIMLSDMYGADLDALFANVQEALIKVRPLTAMHGRRYDLHSARLEEPLRNNLGNIETHLRNLLDMYFVPVSDKACDMERTIAAWKQIPFHVCRLIPEIIEDVFVHQDISGSRFNAIGFFASSENDLYNVRVILGWPLNGAGASPQIVHINVNGPQRFYEFQREQVILFNDH